MTNVVYKNRGSFENVFGYVKYISQTAMWIEEILQLQNQNKYQTTYLNVVVDIYV